MSFTVASYNIRKAVGLDGRRDPDRILTVLREIDADVVALQEADRRFGERASALPLHMIFEHSPYRPVQLGHHQHRHRQASLGWHGNAMLVRRGIEVLDAAIVPLPTLEPRGAIRADLQLPGGRLRVVGMHLDISGIRRRQQVRAILAHVDGCDAPCPAVLMGDLNAWTTRGLAFREFGPDWRVLSPGRSFPSRRPVAMLDRIVVSPGMTVSEAHVHHSTLAARGSDHLPVWARCDLPKI